jgi:hypothetical protein
MDNVFITCSRAGTLHWQKDGFLPGNLLTERWGKRTVKLFWLMGKICWQDSCCLLSVFHISSCISVCRFSALGDETLRRQTVKWTKGWQAFKTLTDFRLSRWFFVNVHSIWRLVHLAADGCVHDVPEPSTVSISASNRVCSEGFTHSSRSSEGLPASISSFTGFYNPLAGFSLLILEVSRSHTVTHHRR